MFVVLAAATLGASRVLAFSSPDDYGKFPKNGDPLLLGFGAGRYYTGSPADGYSCENCHSAEPPLAPYSFPIVQTGLPLDGYVPGQKYNIEISSPVANAQLAAAIRGMQQAVSTLTAEFIAEDGSSAGTVNFPTESDTKPTKFPGLWCNSFTTPASGADTDQYGMNIYAVDTNSTSLEITLEKNRTQPDVYGPCTVGHGKDDEGVEYERRCVIATKPCGVQSAKFVWTAPPKWAGTIWFSLGFVATYDRTSKPNDADYVTTMNIPMNPAYGGPTHETKLDSGCSVVAGPPGSAGHSGMLAVMLGLLGSLLACSRRRRRSSASRLPLSAALIVVFVCLSGAGCAERTGLITDPPAPVGAYEGIGCQGECELPVTCRKVAWPDPGTSESLAQAKKAAKKMKAMMGPTAATDPMSNGTAGTLDPFGGGAAGSLSAAGGGMPPNGVKTLGQVMVSFTTTQPAGLFTLYQMKECMNTCSFNYATAWIEDANGAYVRMLELQQGMHVISSLLDFIKMGNDCEWPQEKADVITSATNRDHRAHLVTWDGMYGNGKLAAPAGLYHLKIEIAIDEDHPVPTSDYTFMFGDPAPSTLMFGPETYHTGVTLTYTPNP